MKSPLSMETALHVAFCLEGRDKINKIVQYGSRGIAWYILCLDPKSTVGKRFQLLYKAMQQSRKAFRLGKSVLFYRKFTALCNNQSLEYWEKQLQIFQNAAMCAFFIFDNIAFLGQSQALPFDGTKAMNRGGTFWFFANIAGFMVLRRKIQASVDKERSLHSQLSSATEKEDVWEFQKELDEIQSQRMLLYLAMIKISCDLIVSSNTGGVRLAERVLGNKLNDGVIGFTGCISALIVLYNTALQKK